MDRAVAGRSPAPRRMAPGRTDDATLRLGNNRCRRVACLNARLALEFLASVPFRIDELARSMLITRVTANGSRVRSWHLGV